MRLCPRELRKGSETQEGPGVQAAPRAGRRLQSPRTPPFAAGWQSWGRARPPDPRGGPAPAAGRPAVGGGVVTASHPPGQRLLLKLAEPLAAFHSSFPLVSLPRDGFGTELCLQVQVLRDLVRQSAPAAATHHSDTRQGQSLLWAARCPVTGTELGALSWNARIPRRGLPPWARAPQLQVPKAGAPRRAPRGTETRGAPAPGWRIPGRKHGDLDVSAEFGHTDLTRGIASTQSPPECGTAALHRKMPLCHQGARVFAFPHSSSASALCPAVGSF